jgi:putative phosphoribosyl transferase
MTHLLTAGQRPAEIPAGPAHLPGILAWPPQPSGMVLFVHGSGSGWLSPRNAAVAQQLRAAGLGTLLFDLLTEAEAADRRNVFDIDLLGERLLAATVWLSRQPEAAGLPLGYFGASTGAAAALQAAAASPIDIAAVV